ncbi:hypothetical protein [Actinomadura atramentaria]|uniref:hypothetical protein n=1 Tax=Actinomadura atramentaria TaxID=1990 RepID=UPI000372EE46|nr:hypothetical protein [Actinomadura atramentaria]
MTHPPTITISDPLGWILDWVHLDGFDGDLTCTECGTDLRAVETGDSLGSLTRTAIDHARTCVQSLGVPWTERTTATPAERDTQ